MGPRAVFDQSLAQWFPIIFFFFFPIIFRISLSNAKEITGGVCLSKDTRLGELTVQNTKYGHMLSLHLCMVLLCFRREVL